MERNGNRVKTQGQEGEIKLSFSVPLTVYFTCTISLPSLFLIKSDIKIMIRNLGFTEASLLALMKELKNHIGIIRTSKEELQELLDSNSTEK